MGKKKGAANKLAKMSDEERARYLQHRADLEEEARRRKQQLIAIFLKNKLKREDAFSRLNMAKINQEWRTILRNIKCVELRNEAKNVQTYFADAFERKNQKIERLLAEIDQQEEMYVELYKSHMESINKFIDLHGERLAYWTTQYENEKKILLDQYEKEIESYKERKFRAYKELECVHYALQSEYDEQEALDEKEHQEKLDDIKSKMILKLQEITKDSENKMNKLWSEFQQVLRNYSEKTSEKYAEYVEMREKDNADTKEIHDHYLEIAKATRDISLLKGILEAQSNEHQLRVDQMKQYQDQLKEKQKRLKADMSSSEKMHKKLMKTLVISGTDVNTKLDKILAKGKQILQLIEICSKYETEREKVQSFKAHSTADEEKPAETQEDETLKDFKELNLDVVSKMENFWIRFKNVEIDCACLEEERHGLQKENAMLKEKLKQYLEDVSVVNGRVGSSKERLRPQSMKIERLPCVASAPAAKSKEQRRPVTGVEGNLSVAVRSKSLVQTKAKTPNIFSVVN